MPYELMLARFLVRHKLAVLLCRSGEGRHCGQGLSLLSKSTMVREMEVSENDS